MFAYGGNRYMKYGPYICIAVVLGILFILWAFWGGKNYEFVGLAPLAPDTCGSYTGSLYNWGNITPATGYDPVEGHPCVPHDIACSQESNNEPDRLNNTSTHLEESILVDNTPTVPVEFQSIVPDNTCPANNTDHNDHEINSISTESELTLVDGHPIILDAPVERTIVPFEMQKNNSSLIGQLPQPRNPASRGGGITRPPRQLPVRRGRFISRGEKLCCQTMERIYGVTFTSIWPDWLINPETGETLELDCYNDELKIAVEYNGEQHYKWPNFTNQTYQQFINQVRRDNLKVELCDRNGVYLIVVPYNVSPDKIPEFIMSYLPETIQKRLQEEQILSRISR